MDDRGQPHPHEDAGAPDAIELEVSDLTPRAAGAGPTRQPLPRLNAPRARRLRLLLAAGTALVLAAVLIAAAWPALGSSLAVLLTIPTPTVTPLPTATPTVTPLPTPTPYPTPTHSPLTTLGPAPHDCPSGPAPRTFSSEIAPGVGSAPVWVVANFSRTSNPLTLHVYRPSPIPLARTLYGWPAPLIVAVPTDYSKPISFQAWNATTGGSLWFNVQEESGDSVDTVRLNLDPTRASDFAAGLAGGLVNWFPVLYIPAPGCYVMQASWPGGVWEIPFAAGA